MPRRRPTVETAATAAASPSWARSVTRAPVTSRSVASRAREARLRRHRRHPLSLPPERRTGHVDLEAAASRAASRARRAVHLDHDVAEVGGRADRAAVHGAVEEQPAADARADGQHDDVPRAGGRPGPGLGEHRRVAVVVDEHRDPEALGHDIGEGHVHERKVVGDRRDPAPAIDQAGDPEADRVDRPTGGAADLVDGRDDGVEQLAGLQAPDPAVRAVADVEPLVERARQELRPAEVHPDDAHVGHVGHHTPAPWTTNHAPGTRDRGERPQYTVYRSRPRYLAFLDRRAASEPSAELRRLRQDAGDVQSRRRPWTAKRVLRWIVLAIAAWLALSFVLFMVSAQFKQEQVSPAAERALDSSGPMPFFPNTILVLGSDARPKRQQGGRCEPRRPEPVGHDHADPHRRREVGAAVDPARHRGRHPGQRPEQDQRRLRLRRRRPGDHHGQALPRHRDQPRRRGQLRELPRLHQRARRA